MSGLVCLKRAYLGAHSPELAAPLDASVRLRMAQGAEVGRLARLRFDGALVETPSTDMERAAGETQRLIEEGARVLFEAAFVGPRAEARVDVLELLPSGAWHVIEVKSSKEPKPEQAQDLAFQVIAAREAGLEVERASLLLVAGDYLGVDGPVDVQRFFRLEEMTDVVLAAITEVSKQIDAHIAAVGSSQTPVVAPNVFCIRGDACPFVPHCFDGLPKNDVTSLPRISVETVLQLDSNGVRDIAQIPAGFKLSARQSLIASVVQHGVPFVSPQLHDVLEALAYPLHFIDFEASTGAVPLFPGAAPYMSVPFQWSDHVMDADGTVRHMEFLQTECGDPRGEFVRTLWEAVKDAGTVLHYSHFEKTRLKQLVEQGVPLAELALAQIEQRGVDLERIVIDHVYLEEFRGKSSIKAVYPALVPDSGYKDLEIQGGEQAAAEYRRMFSPATTESEARRIARDLLAYCERDTLAMLEVFKALRALAKTPSSA